MEKYYKKRMFILLTTILLITVSSILFGSSFSAAHESAKESPVTYKYYKSIIIQDGDTLWDIACKYKTDDYKDTQEYVDELKGINSLDSDNIQESKHLMIVYYAEEFQ